MNMDDVSELKSAIDNLQARLREEIANRIELERRCSLLEKLAYRDPTTGLRTEQYMRARVHEEIARSIRYPSATTLITMCSPKGRMDNVSKLGQHLTHELRASDHIFGLNGNGLAILLVETPAEGAQHVIRRLATDLEQFISGYGLTVTSFPVDTNLADEFLSLAMERHNSMAKQIFPEGASASSSAIH